MCCHELMSNNKKQLVSFLSENTMIMSKLLTLVDGDVEGVMVGLLEGDRVG